jgi:hypothetical protein
VDPLAPPRRAHPRHVAHHYASRPPGSIDGLVNTVLIIDEQWVCRFSKDERGMRALAREAQILALVRHYVDLAVPAFEYHEADFVAYRLIEGRPLYRHDVVELDYRGQDHLADEPLPVPAAYRPSG